MIRNQLALAGAVIAFMSGMFVEAYRGKPMVKAQTRAEEVTSQPYVASKPDCDCLKEKFPRLINDAFVTQFNGDKLNALWSSWAETPEDLPYTIEDAEVLPIGAEDLLVSYGDSVVRLNQARQIVWEHRTAQFVFDIEYVKSTNLVYLTAGDNVMSILNGDTGAEVAGNSRNGSAAYGGVQKYGKDICLVTDNFTIYRDRGRRAGIEPMNDGLAAFRGTRMLWHVDFPPDAELVVGDKRIIAVTKTTKAIYVKEVTSPQNHQD